MTELEAFEQLKPLVRYDKEHGKIFWLNGVEAGYTNEQGYRLIGFKRKYISTHRFIYWLETGEIHDLIDHKKGLINNHISNLRPATRGENNRNVSIARKDNVTGVRGIGYDKAKGKYRARIDFEGKRYNLGYFSDVEEAKAARDRKARELFGEFYREC